MTRQRHLNIFLTLTLFFGVPLVFLTPPFQVPDEPAHFLRAYQISQGEFVAPARGGLCGGELPSSLGNIFGPFEHLLFKPKEKTNLKTIVSQLDVPLDADKTQFFKFANVAYSPIPYLPQSLAIAAGRALRLSPLRLMYLGRLANLLAFCLFGGIALLMAPCLRRPLMLLMMMPMMLFLAASLSADVMTDAIALLWGALMIRAAAEKTQEPLHPSMLAAITAVGIGLVLAKSVYYPLIALAFLIPAARFGGRKARALFLTLLMLISLAADLLWLAQTSKMDVQFISSANPHAQIAYMLHHPLAVAVIAVRTLAREWRYLPMSFVGSRLGWLDARTNVPFVLAYGALMLASLWPSREEPQGPAMGPVAGVVLASGAGVLAGLLLLTYLFWDPVGYRWMYGLTGRYFIPLAPGFIMLLGWGGRRVISPRLWNPLSPGWKDAIVAAAGLASGLATLLTVYLRYYA